MPTGPVRTVHEMPISTIAHPAEQEHRTRTEPIVKNAVEQQQNGEFWREAEHEYEPPEHDPKYHEPMPTGPVRTVHEMPFSTKAHPAEQEHRTRTEPDAMNYFYEYPELPQPSEDSEREFMEEEELEREAEAE